MSVVRRSNIMRCIKPVLILLLVLVSISGSNELWSQSDIESAQADTKREEIQRYFGYELLLYRYFSLPYDSSININQQGSFVDIGLIFIIFFPLFLLIKTYRRKAPLALTSFYLLFTWVISTSNSFIFSGVNNVKVQSNFEAINQYLSTVSFWDEPFTQLLAYFYKISLTIYQPLHSLGNAISGNSDYVTYPILFTLFIGISLLLLSYFRAKNTEYKYFVVLFWIYAFFWFSFSGGIVWYGNILLILGLFMLTIFVNNLEKDGFEFSKTFKNAFVVFCFGWLFFASMVRISDVKPFQTKENLGKGIYNPVFYEYATGKIDKTQSLKLIYNDIDKALQKINSENKSKVWRVGTSFSYFIKRNNKRIIQDNQLGLFNTLRKRYSNNQDIMGFFRSNNIKYMIVDLQTATIDNTPDKSLTNKYRELLLFIIDNPNMKLIATDRVVGNRNAQGEMVYSRKIYGETIQTFGRFAIYEII